jgi:hypothetical protein
MKTKFVRNAFISAGVLVAFTQLLAAGTHDGVLNLDNTPLGGTIIPFDAPGAGTGPLEGTGPTAISQAGIIVGSFSTQAFVFRGFVRAPNVGTFTEFDAPGAGTGQYQGTDVVAIDDAAGAITGFVRDSGDVFHGFLRYPNGTFLTPPFDAPDAGTGTLQGTLPGNINATGLITGYYVDSSNVNHGFVRAPGGTITEFDAQGAGTGPGQGTFVSGTDCLTDAGATVGYYVDSNGVAHGFVRAPDGVITEFDAPGAGTGPNQGTKCSGINQLGTILGIYVDSSNVNHGFALAPNGTFTFINVPAAGTGPGQGTLPFNINASGAITGTYIDASNVNHGFLLSSNGITTFDAPGAGTGPGQGTQALCNNAADAITGVYLDSNNAVHGFLRTAPPRPTATPRPRPTPPPRP